MTHTPGPWTIEEGDYTGNNWLIGTLFVGTDRETGNSVYVHITTDHIHASELGYTRALDDARLIAAAPQLLEALKYIANEDVDPWITQICAEAIIKAEGAPYMSYGTQRQSVISLMSTTKPKPPSPQQKGVTNDRA